VQSSVVRPDLRQMFIGILVDAAFSSGPVTPAEQSVLLRVARELRISQQVFAAMLFAHQGGAGTQQGSQPSPGVIRPSLDQAFAQLGLQSTASDAEIKKAYRKLVSQYHPDKLVSRGLPEQMMEMAKTRVREINVAYDQIKTARGFK
jgi:DnaJ like chaperone protein